MFCRHKFSTWQMLKKRIFDIIVTIILLPIILILAIIIYIIIMIKDGFPIFIKQERLTYNGKKFYLYKFRTMITNAEKNGPELSFQNDERITATGRFLRITNLDEIPQFFNVLIGDMSIIGPRPEREFFANEYTKELPEFVYRLDTKAGITGLAQINGSYDSSPKEKLKWDLLYIKNYSVKNDILIVFKTINFICSNLLRAIVPITRFKK